MTAIGAWDVLKNLHYYSGAEDQPLKDALTKTNRGQFLKVVELLKTSPNVEQILNVWKGDDEIQNLRSCVAGNEAGMNLRKAQMGIVARLICCIVQSVFGIYAAIRSGMATYEKYEIENRLALTDLNFTIQFENTSADPVVSYSFKDTPDIVAVSYQVRGNFLAFSSHPPRAWLQRLKGDPAGFADRAEALERRLTDEYSRSA